MSNEKEVITVVAYLPNGDDYCRGCHMGSSSSDFAMNSFNNWQDAVTYAKTFVEKDITDENYSSWDISFLHNGNHTYCMHNPLADDADYDNSIGLQSMLDEYGVEFQKVYKERKDQKALAAARKQQKAKLDDEYRKYLELKDKFSQ